SSFISLVMALRTSGGPTATNGIWSRALKQLTTDHAAGPDIKKLLPDLAQSQDETAQRLVRTVMAQKPDHGIHGRGCKALAQALATAARAGEQLKINEDLRNRVEGQAGKAIVAAMIANVEKNKKEAAELDRLLREKYIDVFPDLSIGKPAPEVVSR